MLDLDPTREAPEARDATTVAVVRDGAAGLEVFVVRRHQKSGFLGGAIVFPGGKLDAADADDAWVGCTNGLGTRAASLADDASRALALAVCAVRELIEEAALVPSVTPVDHASAVALRNELEGAASLVGAIRARGLQLDTRGLVALWRWITPRAESRRFDTRFYVLRAPEGQGGAHDDHETTQSFWATPRDLLDRWARGEIAMAPPTSATLEILARASDVAHAIALAEAQALDPVCPFLVFDDGQTILALPGDPLFPDRLPAPTDPSAPTRFVLEGGRFLPQRR